MAELHPTFLYIVVLILADYVPLNKEISKFFTDLLLLSLRIFEAKVGEQLLFQALVHCLELLLSEEMFLGEHDDVPQNVLGAVCFDLVNLELTRFEHTETN
jgi:hypothetical protein